MKKKKSLSILGIVAAVLLLIVVLITLTLNVLFSQHDTPKIFGNYVYLMESEHGSQTEHGRFNHD